METQLLEAQVLYTVIFTPEWVDILALNEEDFVVYGMVFRAITKMKDEGKTIDYSSILALEPKTKEMSNFILSNESIGMTIIPNKKIFEERVEILKELSAKRQIRSSMVNEFDLDLLKERLEKIHKKGSSRWLTGDDIKLLAIEIMKTKSANSITYDLSVLDKATKGISAGQYVIIAGRPSVGKSAFLQNLGLRNAQKGKKVLFVSAEMSEEMIIGRIMTTYRAEDIPPTFNILIASDTGTIEAEINRKGRDFDLILVDYIQLLKSKGRTRDIYERITNISSELKGMATKFNLPFVCASQFSRAAEGNQPNMAHLKESGALEQDADVVISLWRHKGDDDLSIDDTLSTVRVDLLKNRNGWCFSNNDIKIYSIMFKKSEFRFYDVVQIVESKLTQSLKK